VMPLGASYEGVGCSAAVRARKGGAWANIHLGTHRSTLTRGALQHTKHSFDSLVQALGLIRVWWRRVYDVPALQEGREAERCVQRDVRCSLPQRCSHVTTQLHAVKGQQGAKASPDELLYSAALTQAAGRTKGRGMRGVRICLHAGVCAVSVQAPRTNALNI
jgi:hypothetical protein